MSVRAVQITRVTEGPSAELAAGVGTVDLYEARHDLGTTSVVVAAYRVGSTWKSFPWAWFESGDNRVVLQVPSGTDLSPHEILIID